MASTWYETPLGPNSNSYRSRIMLTLRLRRKPVDDSCSLASIVAVVYDSYRSTATPRCLPRLR